MAPMHVRLKVALAGVVLSTSIVSAQQAVRPGTRCQRHVNRQAPRRSAHARDSRASSTASPSTAIKRRCRTPPSASAISTANAIEQIVTANAAGEFSFVARPGVAYVVEIADQPGRIVAVGDVIVGQRGRSGGRDRGAAVRLCRRWPACSATPPARSCRRRPGRGSRSWTRRSPSSVPTIALCAVMPRKHSTSGRQLVSYCHILSYKVVMCLLSQ